MNDMKIRIVIPTYNGGKIWERSAKEISKFTTSAENVLVIDSSSKDSTIEIAKEYGFNIKIIPSAEFNHGGTRNKGVRDSSADIVIFLTQDAIPEDGCIQKILEPYL